MACSAAALAGLSQPCGQQAGSACAQIGELISRAMERVGRQGVVTMEESRTAEDNLYVVEGMQFDRGYISPYFVTDPERMVRSPSVAEGHSHMAGSTSTLAWCTCISWRECLGRCPALGSVVEREISLHSPPGAIMAKRAF